MTAIRYMMNKLPLHDLSLDPRDAETLSPAGAERVLEVLALRGPNVPTPLHALPGLARELGIGVLHVKDEGFRLGLGSFKALGGAYALMILVQEEAARRLGRPVPVEELMSGVVREIAKTMTFACATDGNHGRSVAQGAQLMGARAVIFVHSGVSTARIDAIARFGAEIVRVEGGYDFSVAEAARIATENGWTILSDTSWPGYEYIPGLVSQGYTAIVREILEELPEPPTHVFLQAGVGGFAAAVPRHTAGVLGGKRPHVPLGGPAQAALPFESARQGRPAIVHDTQSTIMAMLECHEASPIAFRVLERVADGFMTVEEDVAPEAMRRLASPVGEDPAIVAGESGGGGLAGGLTLPRDTAPAASIRPDPGRRVLVINTKGATHPALHEKIVGRSPQAVLKGDPA